MNFFIFFIFYIISSIILFTILFILYKIFLKKLIYSKLSEDVMLKAFDSLDHKSILDINLPIEEKQEESNEKVYTYF